jgi:hypothetical protein
MPFGSGHSVTPSENSTSRVDQADGKTAPPQFLDLPVTADQHRMRVAGLHEIKPAGATVDQGEDHGKVLLCLDFLQHEAVEAFRNRGRRQQDMVPLRPGLEGKVLFRGRAGQEPGQPRGHHRRGDTMARDVDGIDHHPVIVDAEAADEVAANPPRVPQQQRGARPAIVAYTVADQGLLQLPRLDQVAVERIVEFLQFDEGRDDDLVLRQQLGLHGEHAFPGAQAGAKLVRGDGFGEEIVGPGLQPVGDFILFGFRGQEHEIAIAFAAQVAEVTAEFQAGHARHHPVADDDVDVEAATELQCDRRRFAFGDAVAPAAQLHRHDMPLRAAVIHHQDMARQADRRQFFDIHGTGRHVRTSDAARLRGRC